MLNISFFLRLLFIISCTGSLTKPSPRNVRIVGQQWQELASGENVLLKGPNVVVKGSPWLPLFEGNTVCNDTENETCKTFNTADAIHITKTMGWNSIRLGVTWAGAQPKNKDELDPEWVARLQNILALCDKYGIHVILDHHTDMVGSAGCGFGVPMWFSRLAAPELIGKELMTAFPYKDLGIFTDTFKLNKPKDCLNNPAAWEVKAGEDNYNLLNPCCREMNSWANNNALGFTTISQKTLDYLFKKGPGRDYFSRFYRLLSEAVAEYPAAIAMEPMNEPVYLERWNMFETWRACNSEITKVIPDMSVSVADIGEGAVLPKWVDWLDSGIGIWPSTEKWLRDAPNLFYTWHWYGDPKKPETAIQNVQEIMTKWNMPSMLTETMSCSAIKAAEEAGISWSYWHYSQYCDTAPAYGGKLPPESFGACILGWGAGTSVKRC